LMKKKERHIIIFLYRDDYIFKKKDLIPAECLYCPYVLQTGK
jgi:hypothetical protein